MLPKYVSIPQYILVFSDNLKEWYASFKSKTNMTSQLEMPNTENVSLSKGKLSYPSLFLHVNA